MIPASGFSWRRIRFDLFCLETDIPPTPCSPVTEHDGLTCLLQGCQRRTPWPLDMADLPEDRLRLARLWRNGVPQLSSPGLRPFLARQQSSVLPSSALLRPLRDAPPVVSGLSMAIEATVVAARYSKETGQ